VKNFPVHYGIKIGERIVHIIDLRHSLHTVKKSTLRLFNVFPRIIRHGKSLADYAKNALRNIGFFSFWKSPYSLVARNMEGRSDGLGGGLSLEDHGVSDGKR
jgi:hypothetical protein